MNKYAKQPIDWREVEKGTDLTVQSIRTLLDYHEIPYTLDNAPDGGVYIWTTRFGVEIRPSGVALLGPSAIRPRTFNRSAPYMRPPRTAN